MRRTIAIDPASGPVLLTEYASTFPNGLTVINVGYSTVYLGEDALVNSTDGVPLPSGLSAAWAGGGILYAAADGPATVVITDTVAPYSGAIPLPPLSNVWSFAPSGTINPGAEVAGISDGIVIAAFAKITAIVDLTMVTNAGSGYTVTATVQLEGLNGGSPVVLGSQRLTDGGATTHWQATIGTDQQIPYGGYRAAILNSSSSGPTFNITADSTVTLVALPAGS